MTDFKGETALGSVYALILLAPFELLGVTRGRNEMSK